MICFDMIVYIYVLTLSVKLPSVLPCMHYVFDCICFLSNFNYQTGGTCIFEIVGLYVLCRVPNCNIKDTCTHDNNCDKTSVSAFDVSKVSVTVLFIKNKGMLLLNHSLSFYQFPYVCVSVFYSVLSSLSLCLFICPPPHLSVSPSISVSCLSPHLSVCLLVYAHSV